MTNLEWRLFATTAVMLALYGFTYCTDMAFTQAEQRDMGARANE